MESGNLELALSGALSGARSAKLALDIAERNTCLKSGVRSTPAQRRVWGLGRSPKKIWGGTTTPPILTNSVEFINKCLLFFF